MARTPEGRSQKSDAHTASARPYTPAASTPINTDEVIQRLLAQPGQVQRHESDHLQRTLGNQAVGRLVQQTTHSIAPGTIQRDPVKIKSDSIFHNKDKRVVGKEKRSSAKSRQETEALLGQSTEQAAAAVHEALTSGFAALAAFERVTFAMAGHDGSVLRTEYQKVAGRDLRRDFDAAFSSQPGPMARDYLDGCLFNNGLPTLRGRVSLALRLVDNSGSISKLPGSVGGKIKAVILSKLGNPERVLELMEAADPAERLNVWNDTFLNSTIKAVDEKMHKRLGHLIEVDTTKKAFDTAAASGGSTAAESQALAEARDKQLANMVIEKIKALPGVPKIKEVAEKVKVKITGTGYTRGSMGNIKFDAKKFQDDLLAWKSDARPEDIRQVQLPNSAFAMAMKRVPTNWLSGVDKDERKFFEDFIAKLDPQGGSLSGSDTQVEAVSGALGRQKAYVNRGNERGWLKTRIPRLVADKKWRALETEIKLLSAEQRKQIVNEYDPEPSRAMQMLEEDLKAAGFNKEERATISALFVTDFGDIGGQYADLKELVQPNTRTQLSRKVGHVVNPKKWSKASKAFNGTAIGDEAFKIILKLEENEFVLLRNDKALLGALKEHSTPERWQAILDAMGMANENDQVAKDDTRKMIHKAELDAEGNPKRWALILDYEIEDFKVMKNTSGTKVGVGRDKAGLYRIGIQIQNAARKVVRNGLAQTPEEWMLKVIKELSTINHDKLQYIHDSLPAMWDALKENKPIPLDLRVGRAKHEGFGIGSKRKVDRQKLYWTFQDVQGRQLLDEWSNLDDLRALHAEADRIEKLLPNADDNERPNLVEALGDVYLKMQQFTLGINEKRRAEFKSIGVGAEDRIKLEQMVIDRIADATEDDFEVQSILDDLNMPYDDYLRAKMKGISALEMQRYLDTTRQWHIFSTKGSQLSEGTRNVKGNITSTEGKLNPKQKQFAQDRATTREMGGNLTQPSQREKDEIGEIRETGGKKTEEALEDRALLEARFRDMQARLRKYATVIFKLLVSAIIMAIVSASTFGAGAPLSIGLHFALEAGFTLLQAAFNYYVLRDRGFEKLAVDFAMNLVDATVRVLTANLGAAMQASILHPDMLLPGADWLSRPIAKQLSGMAHQLFMFLPKQIVAQVMHEKPLEKVIEEGEDSIAENAVDQLVVGNLKGFITKIATAGLKEGKLQGEGLITGEGVTKEHGTLKTMDKAWNDRMVGGSTQDEQDQMWGRYKKQKVKGAKKEAIKALTMKDKLTEQAEKKQRKDEMKEMRKEPKNPTFKAIKEAVERNLVTYRKKRGEALLRQLHEDKVPCFSVLALEDEEKGSLEKLLHMEPGGIDTALAGSQSMQLVAINLRPWHPLIVAGTKSLADFVLDNTVSADSIKRLTLFEKQHLALYFNISVAGLRMIIGEGPLARPRPQPRRVKV